MPRSRRGAKVFTSSGLYSEEVSRLLPGTSKISQRAVSGQERGSAAEEITPRLDVAHLTGIIDVAVARTTFRFKYRSVRVYAFSSNETEGNESSIRAKRRLEKEKRDSRFRDGRSMKRLLRKNGRRDSSGSRKMCWNVFKNQAREFCLATGLHGYKYVAQSQRSKIERYETNNLGDHFVRLLVLRDRPYEDRLGLLRFSSNADGDRDDSSRYMELSVSRCNDLQYQSNIPQSDEKLGRDTDIALLVCFVSSQLLSYVDVTVYSPVPTTTFSRRSYPSNMSKEFLVQEFRLLLELLDPGVFEHDVTENLTRLQDIIDDNGLTITEVMEKVTKNCSDLLISCKWNDDSFECDEFFDRVLTRDGICCSFNYVSPCDVENSYDIKPRKIPACGYQTGLAVTVNPDPEDYFATILGSFGVKVLVHDPYDYPDHNANDKLIGLNKQAFLSVAPEETYAMLDVKDLAVSTRNCVFSDEGDEIIKDKKNGYRGLTSGRYSYINCMAECRANTIKNKCDCIPYYFPSSGQYIENVSEARVCNLKDVKCLSMYRSWYDTSWPGESTEGIMLEDNVDVVYERPCGCIPDCTLFRYPVDISQGILDTNVSFDGFRYLRKSGKQERSQNQSIIHVFFSDLIAIQYLRRVHYNWRNLFGIYESDRPDDISASFGGLLGLFVGFSLMSAFEIIYFFVIRIITDRFVNNDRKNRNESRNFVSEIENN
ncbi:sodium channel protein Nach-like [Vespula squamosa]|uniref:Sodium channel protein Nach-like n=1 Tax=Vespula squamosa TaxID=30214 RepID=A0ABD1ZZA0_VESSQ